MSLSKHCARSGPGFLCPWKAQGLALLLAEGGGEGPRKQTSCLGCRVGSSVLIFISELQVCFLCSCLVVCFASVGLCLVSVCLFSFPTQMFLLWAALTKAFYVFAGSSLIRICLGIFSSPPSPHKGFWLHRTLYVTCIAAPSLQSALPPPQNGADALFCSQARTCLGPSSFPRFPRWSF